MKHFIGCSFLCLLIAVSPSVQSGNKGFSSLSTSNCSLDNAGPSEEIFSPDRRNKITFSGDQDGDTVVTLINTAGSFPIPLADWPCPDFLWAPDSKAFFANYSDGGSVGNFHVMVFWIDEEGISSITPIQAVREDFVANYPKCYEPEEPNFAGINWIDGSRKLLIAAEVLPHSNCDMMGTFKAYEVEAKTGVIITEYSQMQAKQNFWSWLGDELRNANDRCFIKPGSCEIPDLHKDNKEN